MERAGAAVGVPFTLGELAKLERRGKLPRRTILLALAEAMTSPTGIGLRDDQAFMFTAICLAAVFNNTLYAVTGQTDNKGSTPAQLWGWLKPWYRELAKNRPKIDAWLAKSMPDRLELPFTALPVATVVDEVDGLRKAIVASPDDDAPRLVLSDLLQQRGDPHGELIALQVNHPNVTGPVRTRITELLGQHAQRIAGDVHAHATKYEIARGFVDSVTMTAAKFGTHGERLFTEHPIRELVLRPLTDPALAKLATAHGLARVRALKLTHEIGRTTPTALSKLLSSPHFERLEALELSNLNATDAAAAFAALRAPRLRSVTIADGIFQFASLLALLTNPALPPFSLTLAANLTTTRWIPPASTELSTIAEAMGKLTALTIRDDANLFAPAQFATMFSAPNAIASLTVRGDGFGDASLDAITASPHCKLRSLSIAMTAVDAYALARFLASPAGAHVERLIPWTSRVKATALHDVLVRLPKSHPLRYVAGVSAPPFQLGDRYIDAYQTDHPDAARLGWDNH